MSYGSLATGNTASGSLRDALLEGPVVGTFQVIGHPAVTELLAIGGAEVIVIDSEHAALDATTIEGLVRAGDVHRARLLVRVPAMEPYLSIGLDMGVAGVVIPHVQDGAQAREIVRATRFPPLGERGIGPARAAMFGLDMAAYLASADNELVVVAMVETRRGVENVDEIVSVPGIDVIFIGPTDLAASLGTAFGSEQHLDAIETVIAAALAAGKVVGIHCADAADARRWADRGVRFLLIGTDSALLATGAADKLRLA